MWLIINLIKMQTEEIGQGISQVLDNDIYDAIADNALNMVFANYEQSNRPQKLLAKKHHCLEQFDQPVVH